ncbi:hypothetical protein [Kumtagia ephedrae]|uniref:hypothetical protein n=1 Tax=Kumtagia ephedrae TaxID=2116701 RepID=UPI001A9C5907|nr:hypothetical protein [Mesorhizobium ephedrae]
MVEAAQRGEPQHVTKRGVDAVERQDTNRAAGYRDWLETILEDYDGRILPIAIGTMRMWGPLTYDLRHTNPDLLIAATALERSDARHPQHPALRADRRQTLQSV